MKHKSAQKKHTNKHLRIAVLIVLLLASTTLFLPGVQKFMYTIFTESTGDSQQAAVGVPNGFVVGSTVQVTTAAEVFSTPGKNLLGTQEVLRKGTIVLGPHTVGSTNWWKIKFSYGIDGWVAQKYLSLMGTTPGVAMSLTATPAQILSGASTSIVWSSTGASSCTASGAWSGDKSVTGSASLNPTVTSTYTLTCKGTGESMTQSVVVGVSSAPPQAAPTLSLSASPTSITSGQTSTLTWTAGAATSCTASGAWSGTQAMQGSLAVTPTANAMYTLTCTGASGAITKSASVSVTALPPPPTSSSNATPATLKAVLAGAQPGATIRLAPGAYAPVTISGRTFAQPITIIATGATFGPAKGSGVLGYAFYITNSSGITVVDGTFADSVRGVVINQSRDISFTNPVLIRLQTDGLDIAQSQRVTIQGASCANFTPLVGDHPDCIQGWSRPGGITADVRVEGTRASGAMQGIFFGNQVRNGVNDGGFDRLTLVNNVVRNTYPNGVACSSCRNSTIKGNDVKGIAPNTYKTNINVTGTNNTVCGNLVPDVLNSPAAQACVMVFLRNSPPAVFSKNLLAALGALFTPSS